MFANASGRSKNTLRAPSPSSICHVGGWAPSANASRTTAAPQPATEHTAAGGRRWFRPSPPHPRRARAGARRDRPARAAHRRGSRQACAHPALRPRSIPPSRRRAGPRRRPLRRRASEARGLSPTASASVPGRTLMATCSQTERSRCAAHSAAADPRAARRLSRRRSERNVRRQARARRPSPPALMRDRAARARRASRRSLRCRSRSANGSVIAGRWSLAIRDDVRIVGIAAAATERGCDAPRASRGFPS